MSIFKFTNPLNGQTIEVSGPATLTAETAQRIFQQQLDAGSLIGLKPGDAINSATQLASGLKSALGELPSQLTAISGTIENGLGGIAGTINSTITSATKSVTTLTSLASKGIPSDAINLGDVGKQVGALMPIQGLSQIDVRGAMTAASKMVNQASNVVSNIGVGKFGLDASQLELTGVVKPGTVSNFLSSAGNSITSVLNSPAVFTGKLGINSIDDLLGSIPKQDFLQQDLMSRGLSAVQDLGLPIDKLNPQALAGTALNAAKNVTNTLALAAGKFLPNDVKTAMDGVMRNAGFSTGFVNDALNDAMKQIGEPLPGEVTVDRATLNAASARIIGNPKVPTITYNNSVPETEFYKDFWVSRTAIWDENVTEYYAQANELLAPIKTQIATEGTSPRVLTALIDTLKQLLSDELGLESIGTGYIRGANIYKRLYETEVSSDVGDYTIKLQELKKFASNLQTQLDKALAELAQYTA